MIYIKTSGSNTDLGYAPERLRMDVFFPGRRYKTRIPLRLLMSVTPNVRTIQVV